MFFMTWESRYLLPDPLAWQGRTDMPSDSCFFQKVQLVNLLTQEPDMANAQQMAFALLGFQCDEGVQRDLGRVGAAEGPIAIRQRLINLPLHRATSLYDVGNIICNDHDLEASQAALGEVAARLLARRIHPIIIGGGHETTWGHYQGISRIIPNTKKIGIISFDAHFDLHPVSHTHPPSATTAFYQIAQSQAQDQRRFDYYCVGIQAAGNIKASFDVAKQLNTRYLLADDLHTNQPPVSMDFLKHAIEDNDYLLISLSLDVFSPAFAPGVSAIQPLGIYPWHVIPLLRYLANSGKVLSYDIVEHVPRYDIDHRTAKLAATLIYEWVHHHRELTSLV